MQGWRGMAGEWGGWGSLTLTPPPRSQTQGEDPGVWAVALGPCTMVEASRWRPLPLAGLQEQTEAVAALYQCFTTRGES